MPWEFIWKRLAVCLTYEETPLKELFGVVFSSECTQSLHLNACLSFKHTAGMPCSIMQPVSNTPHVSWDSVAVAWTSLYLYTIMPVPFPHIFQVHKLRKSYPDHVPVICAPWCEGWNTKSRNVGRDQTGSKMRARFTFPPRNLNLLLLARRNTSWLCRIARQVRLVKMLRHVETVRWEQEKSLCRDQIVKHSALFCYHSMLDAHFELWTLQPGSNPSASDLRCVWLWNLWWSHVTSLHFPLGLANLLHWLGVGLSCRSLQQLDDAWLCRVVCWLARQNLWFSWT